MRSDIFHPIVKAFLIGVILYLAIGAIASHTNILLWVKEEIGHKEAMDIVLKLPIAVSVAYLIKSYTSSKTKSTNKNGV